MKVTVFKEFKFSAAHHLCIEGHPCSTVHGHNYHLTVECTGEMDEHGMVIDFHKIKEVVQPLVDQLDHQLLNDIIPVTTSEGICLWFLERIGNQIDGITKIEVRETDSCGALISLP